MFSWLKLLLRLILFNNIFLIMIFLIIMDCFGWVILLIFLLRVFIILYKVVLEDFFFNVESWFWIVLKLGVDCIVESKWVVCLCSWDSDWIRWVDLCNCWWSFFILGIVLVKCVIWLIIFCRFSVEFDERVGFVILVLVDVLGFVWLDNFFGCWEGFFRLDCFLVFIFLGNFFCFWLECWFMGFIFFLVGREDGFILWIVLILGDCLNYLENMKFFVFYVMYSFV